MNYIEIIKKAKKYIKLIVLLFLILISNVSLIGQIGKVSEFNVIPKIGKPIVKTLYPKDSTSKYITLESYQDGLIMIYTKYPSKVNNFAVIKKIDTLFFNDKLIITNGYKTEYFEKYNYLIISKYEDDLLVHSKGIFLGNNIEIKNNHSIYTVKTGRILSSCNCEYQNNDGIKIHWIQFYNGDEIRRIQLYNYKDISRKNIELYKNNKIGIIQTYYENASHIDSIFNKSGELIDIYKYDPENNLISTSNKDADKVFYLLIEEAYAWDYFYPYNHCKESQLY